MMDKNELYFKRKISTSCVADSVCMKINPASACYDVCLSALCLLGKSRGTVPSPSRSTGPAWITQTWQNSVTAVNSSTLSTAASLRNWDGRDLTWEICLRWDWWGINLCICSVSTVARLMGSIHVDCGVCMIASYAVSFSYSPEQANSFMLLCFFFLFP